MMQRGVSIAAIVLGVLLTIGNIPVGLLCTAAGVYFLYRASRGMGVPLRQRLFPYVALVCFLAACIVNHSMHAIPVMTEITVQTAFLDAMDIESEETIAFSYVPANAAVQTLSAVSSDSTVATMTIDSASDGQAICSVQTHGEGTAQLSLLNGAVESEAVAVQVQDMLRVAAEQAEKEKAERVAAEQAEKEEAERVAAEQAAQEAERIAAEQAAQAEAERVAAEQAAQAEAARIAAEQQAAQNAQSQTVYITNTGSKYHRSGCQYLKKSQIGISLNDATARGYTACSKCY